jgi:methionine-rich copper-binding protein CopC
MSPHVPPTRALTTLLAGLLSLVVLVLSAGPADAHTALVSSDPAASETRATAPQLITLRFSESMNPDLSTIALTIDGTSRGTLHVTSGDSSDQLVAALRRTGEALEGQDTTTARAWRIDYRVVSADGHPVTGTIEFSLAPAEPAASPTPLPPVTTGPPAPEPRGLEDADNRSEGVGTATGAAQWQAPTLVAVLALLLLGALGLAVRQRVKQGVKQ